MIGVSFSEVTEMTCLMFNMVGINIFYTMFTQHNLFFSSFNFFFHIYLLKKKIKACAFFHFVILRMRMSIFLRMLRGCEYSIHHFLTSSYNKLNISIYVAKPSFWFPFSNKNIFSIIYTIHYSYNCSAWFFFVSGFKLRSLYWAI